MTLGPRDKWGGGGGGGLLTVDMSTLYFTRILGASGSPGCVRSLCAILHSEAQAARDQPLMTSAYGEHGVGPALVVCTGSDSVRVGSGADLTFRRSYPCCTGVPKVLPLAPASRMLKPLGGRGGASVAPLEAMYAGGDVLSKAHLLDVTYPVRNGIVDNWVSES
jgi:hypothetical protein